MADNSPKASAPLAEIGGTGLRNDNGFINEEIVNDLRWPQCVQVYRQMETDALIAGMLFAFKQFIRSSGWNFEEYTGDDAPSDSAEQAKFLKECFNDLNKTWGDTLTDILSFLTYGFSVHEVVYKKRLGMNLSGSRAKSKYNDGKIGWAKFPIRSQDTIDSFETTKRGEIKSVHQKDYWNGIDVEIPYNRFLLFRTSAYKDNPYGQSVLRGAYRAYYFRKNLEVLESIGIERNLAGIPVIRVPSEIMSTDADKDSRALRSMYETMGKMLKKNDQAYAMLPSDVYGENGTGDKMYDIELLRSDGANLGQISPIIERWDRRILQSCLSDVLLVGGQSVGSYSLASTKADMFRNAIQAYLDTIADEFNNKAIPMLWELNGWDASKTPRLTHTGIDKIDPATLADFLKKSLESGAVLPSEDISNLVREELGLPKISGDSKSAISQARNSQENTDTEL